MCLLKLSLELHAESSKPTNFFTIFEQASTERKESDFDILTIVLPFANVATTCNSLTFRDQHNVSREGH